MDDIVSRLDEHCRIQYVESGRERLGSLSISDIPGCARRGGYKREGLEPDHTPPSYGAAQDGSLHHNQIQDALAHIYGESYRDREREVSIALPEGGSLKGHVDGTLDVGAETILLEIKTFNAMGWRRLKANGLPPEYVEQANLYMGALGLKKAVFICRHRGYFYWKQYEISFDQDKYDRSLAKAAYIHAAPPENIPRIPVNAKGFLDWRCAYCPYLNRCWKNVEQVGKSWRPKR